MPILIDFLLAPWKLFTVLFGGGAAAQSAQAVAPTGANAPPAATPVPSGLCRALESGAESLTSCRVFGYEMPPLILVASLLIFALFAVSLLWLLRQTLQVQSGLAAAVQVVNASRDAIEKEADLEPIRKVMNAQPTTQTAWRAYEASLLQPGEHAKQFEATQPAEASLPKSRLIDEHMAGPFFALVPGTLTGLGLLMTFVAILDGLSHVTVTAEMDVQGISGLINGLSGKFFSSIVSVFCAVSFVLAERALLFQPEKLYRELARGLNHRLRLRTAEQMLAELLKRKG